jgi:hypothetical protein
MLIWNQINFALGLHTGAMNIFSVLAIILLPLTSLYFIWKMGQKQQK